MTRTICRILLVVLTLTSLSCAKFPVPQKPVKPGPVDPVKPDTPPVWNPAAAADALARLAERCADSEARNATQELQGTLNEMVADKVDPSFRDRVLQAVPAIGKLPARDLTRDEIKTLRGVR